jgi:hypothetical protein
VLVLGAGTRIRRHLGPADMMSPTVTDVDCALHRQAIELERGEKEMQQTGVISVAERSFSLLNLVEMLSQPST